MRLLLVEDEPELGQMVADHLTRQSFTLDWAQTLDDADIFLQTGHYDLLILDLSLPDGDGLDLLRRLRARQNSIPVLAATARDAVDQRIRGLDLGLDDYLVKPFDCRELTARVRALLRRPGQAMGTVLTCGNVVLNTVSMAVTVAGVPVQPGRRGTLLLDMLLRSSGRVVSRQRLEEAIYSSEDLVDANALEAIVSRLRRLLHDHHSTASVQTVRGVGYMMSGD